MVLSKDLKFAICFGLIMGAILSLCNLCFAAENVEISIASDIGISVNNEIFVSSPGNNTGYFEIQPGYSYTVLNSSGFRRILAFSSDVPTIGEDLHFIQYLENNNSYVFNSSSVEYLYFDMYGADNITVTREALPDMNNFIDNLAYSLSIGNLSSVWALVVPVLAISVLLGLGFYLLKRLLNKIKRAKGGA